MIINSLKYTNKWDDAINQAYSIIPTHLLDKCVCPFIVGAKPTVLFEKYYSQYNVKIDRKLNYKTEHYYDQVAHVNYFDGHGPAVIIPAFYTGHTSEFNLYMVVHELGHVLHASMFDADLTNLPVVTHYAATNDYEKFAEAFSFYVLGEKFFNSQRGWDARDKPDVNIFDFFEALK